MKTTTTIGAIIAAAACLSFAPVHAQNTVDIGLYEGDNGNLEVRVIPHADFDGVFSSVVFTLKWDASTHATLAMPLQSDEAQASIAIQPSGGIHEEGSDNYQIYSGIGLQRLADNGKNWIAGKEYTIATIPVNGQAEVELANDAWTNDERNNGDFYVSLCGHDLTGGITKSLALGGNPAFNVDVVPNPNNGRFNLMIDLPDQKDLNIELVNATGKVVFSQLLQGFSGNYRKEMDLTNMSSGVYYLKIRQDDQLVIRKVLFQ